MEVKRKKRNVLTFEEKKEIIEEVKVLKLTHAEAALKHSVSTSFVLKTVQKSEGILEQLEENPHFSTLQVACRNPR
jgi:transposase-like protein